MIDKESYKNLEETNRNRVLENTLSYLENYLNPDRKWDKEITPKERIYKIRYANVNWEAVSGHIKGMAYQNFLKTPYWKAIAAHTKYKAGYRCQLCNSANNLVTHHRNYDIHGFEHAHMHELIVICHVCHIKFHNHIKCRNDSKSHNQLPKCKIATIVILTILYTFLLFFVGALGYIYYR